MDSIAYMVGLKDQYGWSKKPVWLASKADMVGQTTIKIALKSNMVGYKDQ